MEIVLKILPSIIIEMMLMKGVTESVFYVITKTKSPYFLFINAKSNRGKKFSNLQEYLSSHFKFLQNNPFKYFN